MRIELFKIECVIKGQSGSGLNIMLTRRELRGILRAGWYTERELVAASDVKEDDVCYVRYVSFINSS